MASHAKASIRQRSAFDLSRRSWFVRQHRSIARHPRVRRGVGRLGLGALRSICSCAISLTPPASCGAACAHFNHQLRDAAGRRRAVLPRARARRCACRFSADREDVAARARARAALDRGRRARRPLRVLRARSRAQLGADVVALGHTRDDQAETFLQRLVRGAGPRGLSAMHPRNGRVIRPLLDCRRCELRALLAAAAADVRRGRNQRATSASHATASAPSSSRCSSNVSTPPSSTSWPIKPALHATMWDVDGGGRRRARRRAIVSPRSAADGDAASSTPARCAPRRSRCGGSCSGGR